MALDRDEHLGHRRQGVHRQHPERRRAVDEDVVEGGRAEGGELLPEDGLGPGLGRQRLLGPGQPGGRADERQAGRAGRADEVGQAGGLRLGEQVEHPPADVVGGQPLGGRVLGVEVDEQHPPAGRGERRPEADGGGRLARPALLVDDTDRSHNPPCGNPDTRQPRSGGRPARPTLPRFPAVRQHGKRGLDGLPPGGTTGLPATRLGGNAGVTAVLQPGKPRMVRPAGRRERRADITAVSATRTPSRRATAVARRGRGTTYRPAPPRFVAPRAAWWLETAGGGRTGPRLWQAGRGHPAAAALRSVARRPGCRPYDVHRGDV